jgi:hypothetical protein
MTRGNASRKLDVEYLLRDKPLWANPEIDNDLVPLAREIVFYVIEAAKQSLRECGLEGQSKFQ